MNVSTRTSNKTNSNICQSKSNLSGRPAQFMRWLFLLMTMATFSANVNAQTNLISATNGGFEAAVPTGVAATDFTANGWTVINSTANMFFVGTAPTASAGTYCAFTGPSSTSWTGQAISTISHIYTDVTIPAGEPNLTLSFKYKVTAVDATFDFIKAYVAPTSTVPIANQAVTIGQLGLVAGYDGTTGYVTYNLYGTATPGSTVRLIISYRADGIAPNAAAAIDEVSLVSNSTSSIPSYTAAALGGLWSSPATWVGGVVPPVGSDVTIPAGSIVSIDQITNVRNLSLSGTLQYTGTAFALTTVGDFTINSGGVFHAYSTALTIPTVGLGGNFTNNGYANLVACALNCIGSQLGGGSLSQTVSGTGTFVGDGTNGFIRSFNVQSLGGTVTLNTTQNMIATAGIVQTAGSIVTNGKLKIDNTAQLYGQALNLQVANIVVTNMGTLYNAQPVVFGGTVIQYANGLATTSGSRYVSGNNVYLCTSASPFNATPPTSTATTTFTTSGPTLLYLGTVGQLGTPFQVATSITVGSQVFYNGNLYTATVAGIASAAAPPTHVSGTAVSGAATLLYAGTAAVASANWDATTQTARSLNMTSAGSGYVSSPTVTFSVGVAGGTGSGAVATAMFLQQIAGPAASTTQKTGGSTVTGAIDINSDQGTIALSGGHAQSASGVGNISTTNGGVNYTVAPTVGFALPPGINLITNPGSGYLVAPTVTVTGGNLVSGTALATANFTITVNGGKVESVYLNTATTVTYSTLPTLSLTAAPGGGTTATLAFPAGCLPTATANIGSNRQITSFTMTNAGFGYAAAPTVGVGTTSGTANGGTFTTVATAPTARIALYSLILNFFSPATTVAPAADDATVPTSRKMNALQLNGNGNGIVLTNNLTLFGTAPLTLVASGLAPGNVLDLGGFNLNFTYRDYTGTTSTFASANTNTYLKNGSMSLTSKGGAVTYSFPFVGTTTSGGFIFNAGTTPTAVTTGATITRVTTTELGAPSGAGTMGNRAYRVVTDAGSVAGTNPTVTMHYNTPDALTGNAVDLFIGQSTALSGPTWNPRSVSSGSGLVGTSGSRATTAAAPGPVVPTGNDYYGWLSVAIDYTNVSVPTGTCTPTAHLISADIATTVGTITGATITYNNGAAAGPIAMTNTSGSTWQYTIPAASPGNSVVSWSITATNSVGLIKVFTGTTYQDDPYNGAIITVSGTPNPVCSGANISLSASATVAGQTKAVGAGASTSSVSGGSFLQSGWGGAKSQYIIRASELTAAGLAAGPLTSMAFEVTVVGQTYTGFAVNLAHTANTVMTSTLLAPTFTQVYRGTLTNDGYLPTVGVNTLAFGTGAGSSSSFTWDGTSNLLISVCWSSVPNASNAVGTAIKVDAPGFTCTGYGQSDNTAPATLCPLTTGFGTSGTGTNRPRFIFVGTGVPVVNTYTWNDGSTNVGTGNPFIANPTVNTNYTVTISNTASCTAVSSPYAVTTLALPATPSGTNSTQCGNGVPGASMVSGGQNGRFRWYSAPTGGTLLYTSPDNSTFTYPNSISVTTTFYVSESANVDGTGCESLRYAVTATVNAPDPISATPSSTNPCALTAITLTAANIAGVPVNIYTYTWTASPSAGSGIPTSTPGNGISVTPTLPGTYTYTATAVDGSCTTSATTVNVVVKALPVIASATATPPAFCNGGSTNLLAVTNIATAGTATIGNGATTLQGGSPFRAGGGNDTKTQMIYTAAEMTAAGFVAGNLTSIGFNFTAPQSGTLPNFRIYMGHTASTALTSTFDAQPATLVYAPTTITPPAVTGLYTLTFSTPFAWNGTSSILVQLCHDVPSPAGGSGFVAASSTLTAMNSQAVVSGACAATTGAAAQTLRPDATFGGQLGSVGAGSYTWTWNPGSLSGNAQTVSPSSTTTYTVSAFDAVSSCTATQNVLVTVNPVPLVPTANTGEDLCGNNVPNITITSNSGLGTPIFKWYSALTGGTLLQTSTTNTYNTAISATTTFYVTEATAFGCESSPRVAVTQTVNTPDAVSAEANATPVSLSICLGSTVTLSATQTGGNGNTYVFTWTATGGAASGFTGSQVGNPVGPFTPTAVGTYTYTVVAYDDQSFCTATSSVTVTVNPNPIISAASASPTTVCAGQPVSLSAQSIIYSTGTVQIGTGTSSIANNTTVGAFYGTWYGNGHAQLLITAAEMTSFGFVAGNLTDLKIDISAIAPDLADQTVNGFTIKLGSVPAATTSITTFQAPTFTTVYGPTNYTPVVGLNTHTFTTPFAWDGTSSIIVDYCYANGVVGNGSAVNTVTNTTGTSFINHQVDNSAPTVCTITTVSNTSNGRPNIKFTGTLGVNLTNTLTWEWNPGAVAGNPATVNPTTTTAYSVKATDANGCFVTFSPVNVTVNPLPATPTGTGSTQCGTGTATWTATSSLGGGESFRWYATNVSSTILGTASTYTETISSTSVRYLAVWNGTCESMRAAITATVSTPPVLTITPGGATTFCDGGSVSLTASGTGYVNFTWSPGTGLNTTSGAAVTANPSVTTTYTVTADDNIPVTGCANTATVTITVNPNPVISTHTATPATICIGQTSTLSATSVGIGSGTGPTGAVTTSTQGGSPFRAGGASATKTQLLYTAAELVAAGFAPGNFTSIGYNFVGGSGGGLPNFTIRMGHTAATVLTSTFQTAPSTVVFAPSLVNPPTGTGVFTLTFTSPFTWNGTSNLLIEFCHDLPTGAAGSGTIDASTTATAMTSQTLITSACGATTGTTQLARPVSILGGQIATDITGNYNWLWNPGALVGSNVFVSPVTPGANNYSVTATNPVTGCFTTFSPVTVTVAPVGGAPAAVPATICVGSSSVVSANATGGGPFTYLWNDPLASTTASITVSPTTTTTYSVVITDFCGNPTASLPVTVTVNALSTAGIAETGPITICAPATQTLTATTDAASPTYQWTLNGANITTAGTGSTYTVTATGLYAVKVTNTVTGCTNTSASVSVTVNPQPTAVTVNPATYSLCTGADVTLVASGGTIGGTFTLGTDVTTTSTSGITPYNSNWEGSRTQYLIRASELTGLGMTAGNMNSVAFDVTALGSGTFAQSGFTIKMAHTAITAMSGTGYGTPTGSFTTVYGPATQALPAIGFNTLTFSTPFVWDGVSNVLIDICHDNDISASCASCFSGSSTVAYTATSFNSTYGSYDDNIQSCGTTATFLPTTFTNRPNMRFNSATNTTITWNNGGSLNTTTGNTVIASPTTTTTYTATATSAAGCTNTGTSVVTVADCQVTLSLKFYLQGYYIDGGIMQPVLLNQGAGASATETDNVTIELHDPVTYALLSSQNAILMTDGTVSATFAPMPFGPYYIAIKHRNTLQTWSANPVEVIGSTPLYSFSSAATQAFGDNQVLLQTGIWGMMTGDLNQDDYIDGNDFPQYDFESASGGLYDGTYTVTDMNGDGFVDGNDFPVYDGNSSISASAIYPQ